MPIPLCTDYDAASMRALARKSKDGPQARRLLALAAIYERASRTDAARIGALADQPKTLEGNTGQINGFRGDVEAVYGCSMGYDHLGYANIDAKCHRTRALLRAHLAIVDHLLAIEVPDPLLAQIALQGGKGRSLAAARRFAYLAHIDYVQIDEIAKSCEAGHG